jgi:hypothetical protein
MHFPGYLKISSAEARKRKNTTTLAKQIIEIIRSSSLENNGWCI